MEKRDKLERRRYTQEFKLEAIRLVKTGIAKARVARDLGIHLSVLKAWPRYAFCSGIAWRLCHSVACS
jgi:transposase-like protein